MNRRYLVGLAPLLLILLATLAVPVHGDTLFSAKYFEQEKNIVDWIFVGAGYWMPVPYLGWYWGYWYITDSGTLTWRYEIVTFLIPGLSDYYLHMYAIFLDSRGVLGGSIPPGNVDFYFADKLYGRVDFGQRTMRLTCGEETREYTVVDAARAVIVRLYLRVLDGVVVPEETKVVVEFEHFATYELSCSYLNELTERGKLSFHFTGRYVHIRPVVETLAGAVPSYVVVPRDWEVEHYSLPDGGYYPAPRSGSSTGGSTSGGTSGGGSGTGGSTTTGGGSGVGAALSEATRDRTLLAAIAGVAVVVLLGLAFAGRRRR